MIERDERLADFARVTGGTKRMVLWCGLNARACFETCTADIAAIDALKCRPTMADSCLNRDLARLITFGRRSARIDRNRYLINLDDRGLVASETGESLRSICGHLGYRSANQDWHHSTGLNRSMCETHPV